MEFIQKCLEILEPIEPIPTGTPEKLGREAFKAVIFDIYGTLIVSSSGDIDKAEISSASLQKALNAGGFVIEAKEAEREKCLIDLLDRFKQEIDFQHSALKEIGHPYPEIEILQIWTAVLESVAYVKITKESNLKLMAFVFELLSNKIYPMPHMKKLLDGLLSKGKPLGIVSNAQFYTPVIMNYFITDFMYENEFIAGFDKDLCVFSYKMLRAKPDVAIFEPVVESLRKRGIEPHEAVFVGNDMLKDIYTASKVGLKTCLFAGDKRSLRMRNADTRVDGLQPDYIINDLSQLLEIVC